jgi:hypothetical protein
MQTAMTGRVPEICGYCLEASPVLSASCPSAGCQASHQICSLSLSLLCLVSTSLFCCAAHSSSEPTRYRAWGGGHGGTRESSTSGMALGLQGVPPQPAAIVTGGGDRSAWRWPRYGSGGALAAGERAVARALGGPSGQALVHTRDRAACA